MPDDRDDRLLFALPAYGIGAFGGGYLLYLLSSNQHDRSMEAGMTGAFVFGPIAAVIGFAIGALRAQAKPRVE